MVVRTTYFVNLVKFASNDVAYGFNIWFLLQVGPIPVDYVGKEVITRMKTNMFTNKEFYTDSNGRDFLRRVSDFIYLSLILSMVFSIPDVFSMPSSFIFDCCLVPPLFLI